MIGCSAMFAFTRNILCGLCSVLITTLPLSAKADTQKIASAGGTLTELIYALGAQDQLIAVDTSSTTPAATKDKHSIGYYRSLAAEAVIASGAQQLWALEGAGPEATLTQLKNTGIRIQMFSKPNSIAELGTLISELGQKLNKDTEAKALVTKINNELPNVTPTSTGQQALFILQASERGIIAAGNNTVPALLFQYSGIENVAKHQEFKAVTQEYLLLNQPSFLVAPEHVVQSAGGLNAFCQQPALAMLDAAKECRVLVMDSLLSLGMTSRFAQAVAQVHQFSQQHAQ